MNHFHELDWRIIPLETWDAAMAMAIDEAASEQVKAGESLPTIRFWQWQPSAVSIGYFQSMQEEIDLEACARLGVACVRRRTGGGAVYHDYDGEITYSVIAPEEHFPKGILESYNIICGWVIGGLKRLGMAPQFVPINDIVVGGKKISGNAQTRRGGVLLQHGTILYDVDVEKMFSLLKVPNEKIRDKMIATVKERVTSVKHQMPSASKKDVYDALFDAFVEGKQIQVGGWSKAELSRAKQLAKERYSSNEWNFLR